MTAPHTDTPSPWLTREELASRLRVPKSTLEKWATESRGPKYARFGRHVRYRLTDVMLWEDAQIGGGAA